MFLILQRWYNIGTTIPDLETRNFKTKTFFGDTEHPIPWVGCEKNWETLELDAFNAAV